ncbi:DUF2878 domain-containing protein [Variovorax sp. LT1R16]|uniref:DUF2878 domain-containing protein n=1 Tax=Variovorax sp. LT1R16 TaxID=3443728 RepID=UPI003F46C158
MTVALAPMAAPPTSPAAIAGRPTRTVLLANVALSQLAWFAAVLGAAHHMPLAGTLCVVAVICWHLSVSAQPGREALLVALACAIGFSVETVVALQGHVAYPSGQPDPHFAPYWMVALWGLFGIALNVSLRWLRPRLWLAALLGAIVGPVAFSSGVRLGGAAFVHTVPALFTLALVWGGVLPLLVRLSVRFDGVRAEEPKP